jgi:hypothetical protein
MKPLLDETERTLARARKGEDVSAELVRHMRALDELPFSSETYAIERVVWLALLGGRSREGLCALIERELRGNGKVRGLLLDEGDPLREPFPENP